MRRQRAPGPGAAPDAPTGLVRDNEVIDRRTWPSIETIGKKAGGVSHMTIRRAIRELEHASLVSVRHRNGARNKYALLDVPAFRPWRLRPKSRPRLTLVRKAAH